jgi:hypothetical protein
MALDTPERPIVKKEWLRLPSGTFLCKPDLMARETKGCPKCGETVFNINEACYGISCPNCCRTPRDPDTRQPYHVYGKFCMVTLKVVQVFEKGEADVTGVIR